MTEKPDPNKLKEWFLGQIKVELKAQKRLLKKIKIEIGIINNEKI